MHSVLCAPRLPSSPLQAHRNLSQLPNFAFSVPLAYFLLSQQADRPEQELTCAREKASLLLRQALTMFPGGGCSPEAGAPWRRVLPTPTPLPERFSGDTVSASSRSADALARVLQRAPRRCRLLSPLLWA